MCSPSAQSTSTSLGGGGLFIAGVANLNGCKVYENQATVRAPVPGAFLQRPAGTFRVLAFSAQGYGGGLAIYGTATLTSTNVYSNQARVSAHLLPCIDLPPSPRWNVSCARLSAA